VVQVKFIPDRCAIVLRKTGDHGDKELALGEAEATQLLGPQHPAVREARQHTVVAKQRRIAELEAEVLRIKESLRS
jgi:hypothetical protein